ncbi:MAG: hypothetical protein U9Q03_02090 [Patescibacteria group bacterium]|nr:hypothetical protein [Patescibacteria group bacterium]
MRHPHEYTLQLFNLAVKKLPPLYDEKRKAYFSRKTEEFRGDVKTPYEHIRLTITQLGRESWPYRQAYQDMYGNYGRASEEAFLLENLDEGVRKKYEQFLHEGGKLNYLESMRSAEEWTAPTPFEQYFTPEEKFGIAQALLVARDYAKKEIEGLVTGEKRSEYEDLITGYIEKEGAIEAKVEALRKMADVSEKWEPAIMDRVRVIEEGWSVMEQDMDEERLDRELEYWRGTLESFLQA